MDAISDPRFFVVSFLRIAIVCRVTVDIGHFKYSIIVSPKKTWSVKSFSRFLPLYSEFWGMHAISVSGARILDFS